MRQRTSSGWALGLALTLAWPASAATGRLLTTDAAEVISGPVFGLQRTAVALPAGFAIDTSLLADLGLLVNLGVRWAGQADIHRFVVGARYAHFVGGPLYSQLLNAQEEQLRRYDTALSGPLFYAVYGVQLGSLLLQCEGKLELMDVITGAITAGVRFQLANDFALLLEGGYRFNNPVNLRAAGGIRFGQKTGTITLGVAYLPITDPMLPSIPGIPLMPVVDLAWSFQ